MHTRSENVVDAGSAGSALFVEVELRHGFLAHVTLIRMPILGLLKQNHGDETQRRRHVRENADNLRAGRQDLSVDALDLGSCLKCGSNARRETP